jgi:membrane-anchored protein YejM (alkaline phosphatase superfamily)
MKIVSSKEKYHEGDMGWLAHFQPSPRVEMAISVVLLALAIVAAMVAISFCCWEMRRQRNARLKRHQVRPVSDVVFDAATPDPVPAPAPADLNEV